MNVKSNIPFFFLILWTPSRSKLFPYTTLFRSVEQWVDQRVAIFVTAGGSSRSRNACINRPSRKRSWLGKRAAEDRKSTRLNSSHQIISYAVFCLKKKLFADMGDLVTSQDDVQI